MIKHLFLLLTALSTSAFAQNERYSISSHLGYALSDGTNYYYYYSPDVNPTDLRSTFSTGLEIRRQMGQKGFYLQSGIRLNGYGWRYKLTFIDPNTNDENINVYTTNLSVLTIPLTATYKFNKIIPGLTISAGPQIGLLSHRKWQKNNNKLASQWNRISPQYSAFFSLGYEHNINNRWILGGAAFSNLVLPKEIYNFGISISGRYVLKPIGER